MPTYKNTGTTVVTVGSLRIEPNETVETDITLAVLPTGISKLSDAPYVANPVVLSNSYTMNPGDTTTVTLPSGLYNFSADVYCASGGCTVYMNNVLNTPGRKIVSGDGFEQIGTTEKLVSFIINAVTAGSTIVRITVTKI